MAPEGTLATDGNSEIWIYRLPAVTDVDLTLGADLPLQDLSVGGEFQQITDTPASRVPTAGSGTTPLRFSLTTIAKLRSPTTATFIAFISTRNHVPGVGNTDGNPELFFYNVGSDTFYAGHNHSGCHAGNWFGLSE